MKIHVEYVAQLRTSAGVEREMYVMPASSSIGELVKHISERHHNLFGASTTVPGWVSIVAGGKTVSSDHALVDEETVRFLSPMSGG